jgi:hypothetical protein
MTFAFREVPARENPEVLVLEGLQKAPGFSAYSHSSRRSAATAVLRFSSPGAWKRLISGCLSALSVRVESAGCR